MKLRKIRKQASELTGGLLLFGTIFFDGKKFCSEASATPKSFKFENAQAWSPRRWEVSAQHQVGVSWRRTHTVSLTRVETPTNEHVHSWYKLLNASEIFANIDYTINNITTRYCHG